MLFSNRSRINVATQACETCRRRKSRCDEIKPKCSLCQRLNVECVYRAPTNESGSSRDDKLNRVLDSLERLEEKVNDIHSAGAIAPSSSSAPKSSSRHTPGSNISEHAERPSGSISTTPEVVEGAHPLLTAPHRTLLWPAIYTQLTSVVPHVTALLAPLAEGGTSWLLTNELKESRDRLPVDIDLPSISLQNDRPYPSFASRTHFPTLTCDRMGSYANAYFKTFNLVYPILDEAVFLQEIMPRLISTGFGYGDPDSVLTLFVLALGQVAIDSLIGAPVGIAAGVPSGICGGTVDHPPGLDLFNEGRARMGSLVLRGELASVQVLLLQGTYFEASGCHVEYWRSIVAASMTCQLLVKTPGVTWTSVTGDSLSRVFWACIVDEDFYHLDLDLPRTTISSYIDSIPLPNFQGPRNDANVGADNMLEFYFLAKISLHRIISRIHDAIELHSDRYENLQNYSIPPLHVLKELRHQLKNWRSQLPDPLHWSDDDLHIIIPPGKSTSFSPRMFPTASPLSQLVTAGTEILAVELRARFYYAQFILSRPFIFRALHFPDRLSAQDSEYCGLALRSACLLPTALRPAAQKKRLLPHLFSWTQNFIAILSILWIARRDEGLGRICREELEGEGQRVEKAVGEMLMWIRDVRQVDGIAEWSWGLLRPLFEDVQFGARVSPDS